MTWPELGIHAFWQGELSRLAKDFTAQALDVHSCSASTTGVSSVFEHGGGSVLGGVKGADIKRSMEPPIINLDTGDGSRTGRHHR